MTLNLYGRMWFPQHSLLNISTEHPLSFQQVGGLGGKGPASSSLPSLPTRPTSLTESSKFSSAPMGSGLARPNDDYMAVRGYAQKLDQYGTDYPLERRIYGEHTANLGRRDGLSDLDRRYTDQIPTAHQVSLSLIFLLPFSL